MHIHLTPHTRGVPISSPLQELERIVARGESEQVEFKASTGQKTDAVKTVCGMLNHAGGWVLFGVDRGIITGQHVSDDTLESLVRELSRIEPPASVTPEVIELAPGKGVILVRVPGGSGPFPFQYDGRTYLRKGSITSTLEKEEYERFLDAQARRLGDGETHPDGYQPPVRVPYELTQLQRTILAALADGGPASSVALEQRLEVYSNFRILTSLRQLQEIGLVEKTGKTRGARWRLIGQVLP
jgi:predicted HTH transcriptional regulator